MKETALYIHIPFCDHKCIYCDFYSIITSDNINNYLQALKKEISFYAGKYSKERIINTIFFGGGTPSLMTPQYLGEIIEHVDKNFSLSPAAEITMETNPGTVDKNKLSEFMKTGINRISIGIQSFHEDELKFLTRIHNSAKAIETVQEAFEAGFNNISIDLIFNLPGQTKERWLTNLKTAAELNIQHLSTYSLILERGTILNKMVLEKKVTLQDDDYDADLYEATIDFLTTRGFIQYEVSNFAKSGYECIHNKAYWEYKDYLSFGTSSHSFVDGKRWWNFSSAKLYISEVNRNGHAEASHEFISNEQKLEEYTMLALRGKGIILAELNELFGSGWYSRNITYLHKLEEEKFLTIDNKITLTKSGYAVCDEILLNFK